MNGRRIALCAVFVALLISVQYVFGFVPGVELVTVFLLCFCYAAGPFAGMVTATAFSLLRCLVFGFAPNVIILYLVYYNLFALLFGLTGKKTAPPFLCIGMLAVIAGLSAYFAAAGLPVSILYKTRVSVLLWIVFAVSVAVLAVYVALLLADKSRKGRELAFITALAVVCTVLFTLADDLITPLFYGYSADAAAAYFAASLYTMAAQSVCTLISVLLLFGPLSAIFIRAFGTPVNKKV